MPGIEHDLLFCPLTLGREETVVCLVLNHCGTSAYGKMQAAI